MQDAWIVQQFVRKHQIDRLLHTLDRCLRLPGPVVGAPLNGIIGHGAYRDVGRVDFAERAMGPNAERIQMHMRRRPFAYPTSLACVPLQMLEQGPVKAKSIGLAARKAYGGRLED